jgi:CheY-like chemotaxis protein
MSGTVALEWAEAGLVGKRAGDGRPALSTILVVEDEILVRLSIADYLRQCGYRVLEAGSGEAAQAVLRAGEPVDILFSDIDLGPGISGFALAKWTRRTCRDIRIILTSGAAWLADGNSDVCDRPLLRKPYDYEALAEHISGLLAAPARGGG